MITREQCRAARELLGWDCIELAATAVAKPITIHMFEFGLSKPRTETLLKLRTAFESAGVEFDTVNGSPIHRLRGTQAQHDT